MTGSFVVTGTGLVTAAGDTPQMVLSALLAGKAFASNRADDDVVVAAINGFDPGHYTAKKGVMDMSRISQLACCAAAGNARGIESVTAEDVGVVFGSAWGSLNTVIEFERSAYIDGARFVDPILFTETVSNVPAGQVAILYGWSAFNLTVSSGSASGLTGIRQALALLEEGRASVAVAGGGDEINLPVLRALRRRGLVTNDAGSLRLATGRSGPVWGEGACFLTIESEEHARQRGAQAIAAVRSSGGSYVPGVAPDRRDARGSMAGLIRHLTTSAGLDPREVDLVVVSASGRAEGDAEEAGAILDVFGDGPDAPPVMVPKAVLGETWGASGALATALAIEVMHTSIVPAAPERFSLARDLVGLHVPRENLPRRIRNSLILDRTDSGDQLGLVISLMEAHDHRA